MKKKLLNQLLLTLFFPLVMFGQNATVTGSVTDGTDRLIGVSILVENSATGTSTDLDGNYTITLPAGTHTLTSSYVGYDAQSKTITLLPGEVKTLNFNLSEGVLVDEVVVIGSRAAARTKLETAVPVDVIDISKIASQGAQVNLNQILNYSAPSFTSNTQTISDGTDHIDPASLRGLGPDQVLVLINGKRRHTSSLVNVNGTFGRGSVGTDLNAIPAAAISRIEVLRDGAAAQYGSDAIAGVINIILKKDVNKVGLSVTTGAHFSKNSNDQTGGSDGKTTNVSANYGLGLGNNGGYINFTGDFDVRDEYSRMKEWEGSIFNAYNSIEWQANKNGYDISGLGSDLAALQSFGSQVSHFSSDLKASIAGAQSTTDLRSILNANTTTEELAARGLTRSDFNMRVGQSSLRGGRFMANMAFPLDDNGTEIYAFGGIGSRTGNSAGFYRLPNQERTYTPAYINGFLPEINSNIGDRSFAVGLKGHVKDWDVDFSNTYGRNGFDYVIGNTFNASQQGASPTTFDAGGFSFAQNTTNLDLSKYYEDIMSGLNVAFGTEYRVETYEIVAGEEASYAQYTPDGKVIKSSTEDPAKDFFGRSRPGGSQVFPGFSPKNELSRGRSSVAGYIDLEADLTDQFLLGLALRYEDYSDFGSTFNYKMAARYKVTDMINIRGAFNTGFRAPSLHQLNFNSTSTIFDQNGNPQEVGTFSNDSRPAQLLGIPQLKEETSKSISLGVTGRIPSANLTVTVDAYKVNIDDRVVYTGQFSGPGTGTELDNLLSQANASAASFFANAIDTKSKGLDIVVTHNARFSDDMGLRSSLSGTFSKTEQDGEIKASQVLKDAGLVGTYFPEDSRVYLEEAVPRTKLALSNSLSAGKLNVFLRNVYFGEVTEATTNVTLQQVFGTKIVTDLSLGYQLLDGLSLTIGANNLLDVYPDRAAQDLDSATAGDQNNRSDGRFDWSRRAQQFGIGGRFLFARVSLNF